MLCHLWKHRVGTPARSWDGNLHSEKANWNIFALLSFAQEKIGIFGWPIQAVTPMFLDLGMFPCAFSFPESVGVWEAVGYLRPC